MSDPSTDTATDKALSCHMAEAIHLKQQLAGVLVRTAALIRERYELTRERDELRAELKRLREGRP